MWIAAVNHKDWILSEHSWICGAHLISGYNSNNPTSPYYTPSVFSHVKRPQKRKLLRDMRRYERTTCSKRRRIADENRLQAAHSLLELADDGNGSQPHSGTASCTTMTIHNIEQLEAGYRIMQNKSSKLRSECEKENQ